MNNRGFSTIELLGVIGLVTIFATIALVGLQNLRSATSHSVANQNATLLNNAVAVFEGYQLVLPSALGGGVLVRRHNGGQIYP